MYAIRSYYAVGRKGAPEIGEYVKMAIAGSAAALGGTYGLDMLSRWASWETFTGSLTRFAAGGAAVSLVYYLSALLLRSRTARSIRAKGDLFRPPRVRITSYNVCYTKLLRWRPGAGLRWRRNAARVGSGFSGCHGTVPPNP